MNCEHEQKIENKRNFGKVGKNFFKFDVRIEWSFSILHSLLYHSSVSLNHSVFKIFVFYPCAAYDDKLFNR